MADFRSFFKDKKVTVLGLGLLGKRLGDIAFLAECGAKVLVTDLKSSTVLKPSLQELRKHNLPTGRQGNITFVLGKHRLSDFENCDFVLKGQGVTLDSPYITHARKKGIPIEMDESLFAKLAPKVKIIGITGTRGKSTTTMLIYEIIKRAGLPVHLGGNIKNTAALPLLKEVKDGDFVVFELSSWQLQGFAEAKISPHISVFTNFMPDHMNYYKNNLKRYFGDKATIYKFQKKNDFLILGPDMKSKIRRGNGKLINADVKNIPKNWKIKLKGKHNLENISCALTVAKVLGISEQSVKKVVENFEAISGRLELVKSIKGIDIYNDTNSSTPEATSAALQALGSHKKNIVLIMGGSEKNLNFDNLLKDINKYAKAVVLIRGDGTNRIIPNLKKIKNISVYSEKVFRKVILKAYALAKKGLPAGRQGDIVLFSPAFASFGMFNNEYERGDKFMEIVNRLK